MTVSSEKEPIQFSFSYNRKELVEEEEFKKVMTYFGIAIFVAWLSVFAYALTQPKQHNKELTNFSTVNINLPTNNSNNTSFVQQANLTENNNQKDIYGN